MSSLSKRFIVVLLLLALLFVAASSAFIHTSDPSFCARCHSMAPAYEGWQNAPHRNVSCHQCHAAPGLDGEISARLQGLRKLYNHLSGNDKKPLPTCDFDWRRCYECHYDPAAGSAAMPPLPESHLHFSADDFRRCAICHDDVSHSSP
ncbi:MAG: NapC/NirT family cytochrome c [Chloroflexi bacterium]|nr:NapC/NirT family cytochrome c [Chloroflexota bacterium]